MMLEAVTGWLDASVSEIRIDDSTLAHIRRSLAPTSSFEYFSTHPTAHDDTDNLNPTIVDFIQSLDMDWPEEPKHG